MSSLQIPVKIEEVEQILDKEFDADFNNISFDNIPAEKQIETAFLYFRNTGFKFKPDFSKCSNQQIANILETYLKTEYDVPNKYLQEIWIQLLFRQLNEDFDNDLLSEEQLEFVEDKLKPLIEELASFVMSLNVFCILLADNDGKIDKAEIQRTNYSEFGCNLYNILSDETAEDLLVHATISDIAPTMKFYNIYFQKDNSKLVDVVKSIKQFGIILEVVKAIADEQ